MVRAASTVPIQARLVALMAHLVVALVALVVIGGATRVMQAGLACPDWPLCYGQWLPGGQLNLQVFLEWFHRLDAFIVGVALLVLAGASLLARDRLPGWLPAASLLALLLVALQGGLGALTVTQLLASPLVTAHLATALTLVALLSGMHQALSVQTSSDLMAMAHPVPRWWLVLVVAVLAMVMGQSLLGASLASTWSAQRCLSEGDGCLMLLRHRLGARAAAIAVLTLLPANLAGGSWAAIRGWQRWSAAAAALLVVVQVVLGITTLNLSLNVPAVTIGHQAIAALLVALLGANLGRSLAGADASPSRPVEVVHG